MLVYNLPAENSVTLFGTMENHTPKNDVVILAQKPDCSAFLVLSSTAYNGLEAFVSYDGFDFTYCQEWGLTINDEVVQRVWRDIRAKAYPPMTDYLDGVAKADQAQIAKYIADCNAVKAKYPKP